MKNLTILAAVLVGLTNTGDTAIAASATEQVKSSLASIAEKDSTYRAVTKLSPSAKEDAQAVDAKGSTLLGGMPILLKDNIDLKGMATTAGSIALIDNYPLDDAPLVNQLKANGAVILGKANLSEWANFRSEKSSSGWSAVGGQTYNAYDVTRTPCGSSAGSGVAVALGYVKVAIGTETNGSIVCPASINGVVGFKPTHGIVSGEGIVPLALTQDTAGPLADTIDNAALALSAMVAPNAENANTIIEGLKNFKSGQSLKGMKIGVVKATQGFDLRRDAILDEVITKLKNVGVEIVEGMEVKTPDAFWQETYQILQYEFKRDLNAYFKNRVYAKQDNPLATMTLEKLITFNQDNAEQELAHFDQSIFEKSEALQVTEKDYQRMLADAKKATREDGLDKLYKDHNLDALIGITVGPAWKIDHINGDAFFGPSMSSFPAIGGHPHITLPTGKIADMPVGVSFVGKRYQDHLLAQLVYQYSQIK